MLRVTSTIIILLTLLACGHNHIDLKNDTLIFKASLNPAFDETSEILLTKSDGKQMIRFLLMDRYIPDKSYDTFYYKTYLLSEYQFDKFDSAVIQKIKIKQPHQWEGCCDGMPVNYLLIYNKDTSKLYFRSPNIKTDSVGFNVTKTLIDNLRFLQTDSVINDYLDDIEANMDDNKRYIHATDNRAINRLRKIEYSR